MFVKLLADHMAWSTFSHPNDHLSAICHHSTFSDAML
jgi:hypothetical protein